MFINTSWIWISIVFILLAYTYKHILCKSKTKKQVNTILLPPGPKGIPIFGNLLMLGQYPHRDLDRLSKQHGPIMYLRLGFVPTIVVSSPQAAELFLKTHDANFASRPFNEAAKYFSYDQKGISFCEYGSYLRNIRKVCTLELLSSHKIESFKPMRKEELGLLIKSIKNDAKKSVIVDISAKISSLSTDMSCLMVLGKKYIENEHDQKGLLGFVREAMRLAAVPNMADYIPYVGLLDIQGLRKQMKIVSKFFDEMLEKVIDEHVCAKDKGNHKDFVDVMLSIMESKDTDFPIDRSHIKAVVLDMLGGSMETSATAIDWALSELIKNPRVMRKAQEELERVVGMERMVEESDLANLEYLEMVIKESFRLHPVGPLLIPHEAMEDCTVNGFHIPKKSRIMVNTWTIGRDPDSWTDPEEFIPERFMDRNVDLRGHDFQLLPFGSGRRSCPGMQLGLTSIRLVLGQLVHCFDWELPDNMLPTELDMCEVFGITVRRAKHLLATPTYRLHKCEFNYDFSR